MPSARATALMVAYASVSDFSDKVELTGNVSDPDCVTDCVLLKACESHRALSDRSKIVSVSDYALVCDASFCVRTLFDPHHCRVRFDPFPVYPVGFF